MPYLLAFVLTLSVTYSYAQMGNIPARLQWGEEQRAPGGSVLNKIVTAGAWGATAVRFQRGGLFTSRSYYLEHYDAGFRLVGRHELELPENPDAELEDVISLRGQLYWLLSRPDEQLGVSRLYSRALARTGQVVGEERLLAEIDLRDKFRSRMYDLVVNRDTSFLLLYNQLPTQKDEVEAFTLRVFNSAFDLLWSRDVTLPYRDEQFGITEYQLDEEGNVFVLGRLEVPGRQQRADERPLYRYSLFAYTNDGREEQEYQLELGDGRTLDQLTFLPTGRGEIVCAGFATSRSEEGRREEACFLRIDPFTKSSTQLTFLPFRRQLLAPEERAGDPLEPVGFRPRNMILRSDGGAVLVAEQYYRQSRAVPTYQGLQVDTYHSYLDIVVLNIGPDGELDWARRIPKQQTTANDSGAFSSFAMATVRDRFYFVYNDNPRNFSPERRRQHNLDTRESVITLSELTRDGLLTTVPLFVNQDAQVVTRPRMCRQMGSRLMLVYGENGRRYRFGSLVFE